VPWGCWFLRTSFFAVGIISFGIVLLVFRFQLICWIDFVCYLCDHILLRNQRNLRLINFLSSVFSPSNYGLHTPASTHQRIYSFTRCRSAHLRRGVEKERSENAHFCKFSLEKRTFPLVSWHFLRIFTLFILTPAHLIAQKPS